MKSLDEIKTDLSFLKDYEVVIFGSYARKRADKRSDIDIAVITGEKDRNRCVEIWKSILGSEYFYKIRKLWNDTKHRIIAVITTAIRKDSVLSVQKCI